ncbi:MAG: 1-acyl-sn-glycerol-3-phosphate acyltransferase [Xanthomonadales bacterium]|nr:1-acyl-sn-glycerol-3-phosphate acyltransferase [Xanthomonadales bacterium]
MQESSPLTTIGSGWSWVHPLRILLRLPFLLLLIILGLPLLMLTVNRYGAAIAVGKRQLDEVMQTGWANSLCLAFGIHREVIGGINSGPLFVVANHVSFLDILLLGSVTKMSFVSKAEIAKWPLVGTIARLGDTVFHHRGSGNSLQAAIDAISAKTSESKRVAVFPEGRIFCGDKVHRFHARLFQVPIQQEIQVQPVCIRYLRDGSLNPRICLCDREERFFWNAIRLLGEPGSIAELHFLAPISSAGNSRRQLAEASQNAVTAVYGAHGLSNEV